MTDVPIVVLCGPTGAGKSAAALRIAERFGAEIVNVDAFQIYRGMGIGTAQPSAEELARVPHWLYGFQDPREGMSAAGYAALADKAIAEISGRGRRVLLVGGAGFYLRALLYGLFEAPAPDPELRRQLSERAALPGGKEALHAELSRVDPEAAARLPVGYAYRVSRALEVFYQTGRPLSEHHREHARPARYRHSLLALDPPREVLVRRQEARVRAMFAAGWEEEVRALLAQGIGPEAPGFRAIGYRAVAALISGALSREEVVAGILKEHRLYAMRQRTWLRGEPGVRYFEAAEGVAFEEAAGLGWGGRVDGGG